MADNAEELETKIDSQLDTLDALWADGPKPSEQPEAYLSRLAGAANDLVTAVKKLTPEDIDDIFTDEDDSDDEGEL